MKLLFALIVAVFLLGCATAYKPEGFAGGYSDNQITEDTFFVSFRGNGYIKKGQVLTYFLLRCAEITNQNGYEYFVITSGGLSVSNNSVYVPGQSHTTTTGNYNTTNSDQIYGSSTATTTTSPGYTINIKKPYMDGTIKLGKGEKPESGNAYTYKEIFKMHGHYLK